jgi:hypothetical protein
MTEFDLTPENVPRIVASLERKPPEELARLVENLLRVYVTGGARPFQAARNLEGWAAQYPDFASLVTDLKRVADYPELERLVVEGGRVHLRSSGTLYPLHEDPEPASPSPPPTSFSTFGPAARPPEPPSSPTPPAPDPPARPPADSSEASEDRSDRRLLEFDEGED